MVKKKKISRKTSVKLKSTYENGYLSSISNPKGKKKSVYVAEGLKGYSANYSKSFRKVRNSSGRSAEALARRLAKRGHRRVYIKD